MDSAYKGKRVFLTGHTGFKGGWLALWLTEMGAQVTGYALEPPTEPSFFDVVGLKDRVTHIVGDVRDAGRLARALAESRAEVVFHLAAQPLVLLSYDDPVETFDVNVMGTAHLLDAARHASSVRAVVVVTSDKCYENREWGWGYRETDPMGGRDPYSASKGCAELVASSFRRSFFGEGKHPALVATARAGNVIGGGDWGKDRLVPDCVRSLSLGEEIVIRSPRAIRPWQHVLEPLSGYLLLGARLLQGNAEAADGWNFGPLQFEAWTVSEVVDKVCSSWGGGKWALSPEARAHEAHWLRLDASRAALELGWRPRYGVAEAIERTVAWYRGFHREGPGEEMLKKSLADLAAYRFTETPSDPS